MARKMYFTVLQSQLFWKITGQKRGMVESDRQHFLHIALLLHCAVSLVSAVHLLCWTLCKKTSVDVTHKLMQLKLMQLIVTMHFGLRMHLLGI